MNRIAFLEGYFLKQAEDTDFPQENTDDVVATTLEGDNGVNTGKTTTEKTVDNAPVNPKVNSVYADKPSKQQALTAALSSAAKTAIPEAMSTDSERSIT